MAEVKPFRKKPNQVEEKTVDNIISDILNTSKEKDKKEEKKVDLVVTPGDLLSISPLLAPIAKNPNVKEKLNIINAESLNEGEKSLGQEIDDVIVGGAKDLAYSFADLITSGTDYIADTDFTSKLDNFYEKHKEDDPDTFVGKFSKFLITFGLGGGIVTKFLSKANKFAKLKRASDIKGVNAAAKTSRVARRVGYSATVLGATDFISSSPDREVGFIKQESTEGLSGRELAAARFRNRVRFGAEGATIGAGFTMLGTPAALGFKYAIFKPIVGTASLGIKAIDKGVVRPATYLLSKTPLLPQAARLVQNASQATLERVVAPTLIGKRPGTKLPEFNQWRLFSVNDVDPLKRRLARLDNMLSWFRSLGKQTAEQYELTSNAQRAIKGKAKIINKYLDQIEKKAYDVAKGFEKNYKNTTTSKAGRDYYLDLTLQYLKGQKKITDLPIEIQASAKGLADELKQIRTVFGESLPESELKNYFLNTTDTYLRKSFAVFTNELYQPSEKVFNNSVKFVKDQVIKNDKTLKEVAEKQLPNTPVEKAYDEYAKIMVKDFLRKGKLDGEDPLQILNQIKKDLKIDDITIKTGEELPDVIRKLLGEEDNLRASVLTTTSQMYSQAVNKNLYDRLTDLGLKQGWLYDTPEAAKAAGVLGAKKITKVPGLGLQQTEMTNFSASSEIVEAMTGSKGSLDTAIQGNFYRKLLQLKVGTQFGKTVLSPATQVRNVTSASFFPLANGWIGGNASVVDAFKMTLDDIFGAGKELDPVAFAKRIERKVQLGVMDENIVASELQAVMKEIKKGNITSWDGMFNALVNNKFTTGAQKVYAGGDNAWKFYSHEYVMSQLKPILKNVNDVKKWTREIVGREYDNISSFTGKQKTYDEAIEEAAGWYVRNHVPTYSKVPDFVKSIRRLPVGNFVAFPAEMIRTSFNILNTGLKEIASDNAAIRQMGYRRIIGAYTVLGGAGTAATKTALAFTGMTEEQLDAYKRNFAASWDKASNLIPITKFENGKGKFINFSYFSPYDVIQKPFEAAMQTWTDPNFTTQTPKQKFDFTLNLFGDFMGELVAPFFSEAIALERIIDILPKGYLGRGGQTKSGAKVYSEADGESDILMKSFGHILQGIEPGAVTTGKKIYRGAIDDVKKGGTPYELQDELIALFSGIRILYADVPRTMQYVTSDFKRKDRAVFESEKFYSIQDWKNRGPDQMAEEFKEGQEKAIIIQKELYNKIKAAEKLGVKKSQIRRILKDRKVRSSIRRNIFRGKFTPINYNEELMRKRVKDANALGLGRADRRYFYPRRELEKVKREYRSKTLEAPTPPKLEPVSQITPVEPVKVTQTVEPKITTPSLPLQPQPVQTSQITPQVDPNTMLTPTETALLSPTEQAIRQRQRT